VVYWGRPDHKIKLDDIVIQSVPFNPVSPVPPQKSFSRWGIQPPRPRCLSGFFPSILPPLTDGSTAHTFEVGIPWSLIAFAEVNRSDGRWTKRIWRHWPRPDSSCTSVPFCFPRCGVLGSIDVPRFAVKVILESRTLMEIETTLTHLQPGPVVYDCNVLSVDLRLLLDLGG